jgi:hypothetical protein
MFTGCERLSIASLRNAVSHSPESKGDSTSNTLPIIPRLDTAATLMNPWKIPLPCRVSQVAFTNPSYRAYGRRRQTACGPKIAGFLPIRNLCSGCNSRCSNYLDSLPLQFRWDRPRVVEELVHTLGRQGCAPRRFRFQCRSYGLKHFVNRVEYDLDRDALLA